MVEQYNLCMRGADGQIPRLNIEKDKWTGIRMGVSESRRKLCM